MVSTVTLSPAAAAPCELAGEIVARGKHHAQLLVLFTGRDDLDGSIRILCCDV